MEPSEMSFQQYCCLKRPRFKIDPEKDAKWYFGNMKVQESIMDRLRTDVDVRGVPKFGIVGRFGVGKTHNLFHLKHLFEKPGSLYDFRTFYVRLSPYSEDDPATRGWGYIHRKIVDAMGERFLRELVRGADVKGGRHEEFSEMLAKHLKFGDANLQQSLAYVLANYFLRESRQTSEAWDWLKGKGECSGTAKKPETSSDMIDILLNIGHLSRWALESPLGLLFDEAQALAEVKKASIAQIHDSFLQLAEPDNVDVGFVLAVFGTGGRMLPPVIMQPSDILSRLGHLSCESCGE